MNLGFAPYIGHTKSFLIFMTNCECSEDSGFYCHLCGEQIEENIHDDNEGICDDCWSDNDGNPESNDKTNRSEDLGYPS